MSHSTEVFRSLLSSTLQQGRGLATKGHSKHPQEPLELYEMEGCPFCRLVREALTDLDIDVMILPCPKGGDRYRPLVERLGGKQQFPYLMDPNTGEALYGSADIIEYLYQQYGGRPAPKSWQLRLRTAAAIAASAPRGGHGIRTRSSRAPEQALELYSFEASPFARLVRERLTELQLPYLLRQCGRDQWKDWVLPVVRKSLDMDYSPSQRNRIDLLARAGRIAVPYLVDPNTGEELFESEAILHYLDQTYGN